MLAEPHTDDEMRRLYYGRTGSSESWLIKMDGRLRESRRQMLRRSHLERGTRAKTKALPLISIRASRPLLHIGS